MSILVLNETLDGGSSGTDIVSIVHIYIDTFCGLPCDPILDALFEHTIGNDQHPYGRLPKVGMVFIHISDSTTIEQLVIKANEIRAVGLHQHVFGCTGICTVEADFHLNVVEHADFVVDRVVANRLDAHSSYLDATHNAVDAHSNHWFRTEATGLICSFVIDERHIFGSLVFSEVRLTRHQFVNAVFFKIVIRSRITRHTDVGSSTERHCDELTHGRNLRITLATADNGVGQAETRESASIALDVLRLNG